MHLGLPDLGFMDLVQAVAHTMAIRNVVDLPLVVDADTGFGNALNVAHTVRMLERPRQRDPARGPAGPQTLRATSTGRTSFRPARWSERSVRRSMRAATAC